MPSKGVQKLNDQYSRTIRDVGGEVGEVQMEES